MSTLEMMCAPSKRAATLGFVALYGGSCIVANTYMAHRRKANMLHG
jgi:hypothetical protein